MGSGMVCLVILTEGPVIRTVFLHSPRPGRDGALGGENRLVVCYSDGVFLILLAREGGVLLVFSWLGHGVFFVFPQPGSRCVTCYLDGVLSYFIGWGGRSVFRIF